MKLKIFVFLILVMFTFNPFKLFYDSNIPNVYQQEKILSEEFTKLNIINFKEKRREFVRQQTYLVYYDFTNKSININELKSMLNKKFLDNGWSYSEEFTVYDNFSKINKLNINYDKENYYCTVIISDDGMALRFRYKNYYQK